MWISLSGVQEKFLWTKKVSTAFSSRPLPELQIKKGNEDSSELFLIENKYLAWVILSDGFFYPHHTPMKDTFSCIHFDLPHLIFKEELAIK